MSNVLTDVSLWLPQCSSQLSHVCWLNNCVFIRALWFILGKKPNVKTTWSYCYGGDLGDNNSGKGKSGWVRTHGRFQKAEGKMVSIGGQWFICLFYFESLYEYFPGFPWGSAGEESACNVGYLGLIPGLGRPPWRRERLPTSVFWPGESHGCPLGCKESDMTERLSLIFMNTL